VACRMEWPRNRGVTAPPGPSVPATRLATGGWNVRSGHQCICYHRGMADGTNKLVKEVLPPQRPQSGLGVMIVAATAMFFAVASSAFLLRARMAAEGCPGHSTWRPPIQATPIQTTAPVRPAHVSPEAITNPTLQLQTSAECAPIVRTDDTGKQTYYFRPCPVELTVHDIKLESVPAQ